MGTRRRDEDGFTLIELLVVIIVIGILAAIAIPTYLRHKEKAYRAQALHDMKNAALALETYATGSIDASYAGLNGATENTPELQFEGFEPSSWVNLTVTSDHTSYCIEGVNVYVPDQTFVYRSDGGVVEIGLDGTLSC